jgi:hypothetical protein
MTVVFRSKILCLHRNQPSRLLLPRRQRRHRNLLPLTSQSLLLKAQLLQELRRPQPARWWWRGPMDKRR